MGASYFMKYLSVYDLDPVKSEGQRNDSHFIDEGISDMPGDIHTQFYSWVLMS